MCKLKLEMFNRDLRGYEQNLKMMIAMSLSTSAWDFVRHFTFTAVFYLYFFLYIEVQSKKRSETNATKFVVNFETKTEFKDSVKLLFVIATKGHKCKILKTYICNKFF